VKEAIVEPLVSMRGVTKFIYGGDGRPLRNTEVKILDRVDFDVFPGEVHVLVGENGAGKSTLMKILGGVIPPDGGELRIAGETAALANAQEARKHGVAFIHQELNLCANLDVAHNIFLGREPRRRGLKDTGEMVRRSAELLKALGADLDPRLPVSRLSTAQQQLVEIAKAMSFRSRVVIMDEPTASLTKREIDAVRSHPADAGGRPGHCLHIPPLRGDPRHRRSLHCASRRAPGRLPAYPGIQAGFGDLDDGRAIRRRDVSSRPRGAPGAGAGGARPSPRPPHPAHRSGCAAGRGRGPRRPRWEWAH
jgi:ABC-type lipoprotein export system ATPase subunit